MADQSHPLSGWIIARHGDEISVVSPADGPGGGFFKNTGRLEQRVLFALAEAILARTEVVATTVPTLLATWEARSREALPTDAMLINRHIRELREAIATSANDEGQQRAPDLFVAWLEREMPAGTVIGNPAWWAPKLARALRNAERGVLGGCNG